VAAGQLRLDCLGSGNAFSDGRYWSGFLLDRRVLLDCPPQTLVHLFKLGVRTQDIDLILLSHEHSDHIGGMDLFLLDAIYRTAEERTQPLAVAGPPGIYGRLREVIGDSDRLPPRDDPRIVWFEQEPDSAFGWSEVTVECIEVEHNPDLTSLGFRLHTSGRVLAYTGDTRPCDAVDRLAEGATTLIVECGVGEYPFDWPDILDLRARLPEATHVLVTHYGEGVPPEVRERLGLTLAEDFGVYEV
jgi:glyoxylase-like metal-dependent hydrolase (beta-lactamase superfamily II)